MKTDGLEWLGMLEGDFGSSEELWAALLVHWMEAGLLAGGLAGGAWCWLAGCLATGTL